MTADRIRVWVNGVERALPDSATVADLLVALGLDDRRHLAVERNKEVVPKARYAAQDLHDGDVVEVVSFVGGG